MRQVWQTDDGYLFDLEEEAFKHESMSRLRHKLRDYIRVIPTHPDHKDVLYGFVNDFLGFVSGEREAVLDYLLGDMPY